MNKMLRIMAHEIRISLARKSFVGFAFVLPLLIGAAALVVFLIRRDAPPQEETATVEETAAIVQGYVDEASLITSLPPDIPAGSLITYPHESAAQMALQAAQVDGYFLIPADYVASGHLTYVTTEYTPLGQDVDTQAMEWTLLYNLLGDPDVAAAVRQPLQLEIRPLSGEEGVADEENWITELFPTLMVLLIYMVVIMPAGMLVNAVADEKKNRLMELLLASVSPRQFIAGKILALGLLGLLQTAVWVGVFWGVARFGGTPLDIPAGFTIPTSLVAWTLVYGLLGYAMYGVLLAGLGALVPDVKDARTASLLLMSPLILVYIFMIAILERPDSAFALLMSLFPLTAPVGMMARMTVSDVPLWQALLSALLQLLAALFLLRLVARMFRAQTLLSGQPFAIGRYFNALLDRA